MNTVRLILLALFVLAFACKQKEPAPVAKKSANSTSNVQQSSFNDPFDDYDVEEEEEEDTTKKKKKKKKKDDEDEDEDDYDCKWVTKEVRECLEEDNALWDFNGKRCTDVPIATFDCTESEVRAKLDEIHVKGTIPSGTFLACGEKDEGTTIIVQVCQEQGVHTACYQGYRKNGADDDDDDDGFDASVLIDAFGGALSQLGQFQLWDDDDDDFKWSGGSNSCF